MNNDKSKLVTEKGNNLKNHREIREQENYDELLIHVLHQLKSPIATIKMNLELLKDTLTKDNRTRRYFEIMSDELKNLDDKLKDIYILQGKNRQLISEFDLKKLFDDIINSLKPTFAENKIHLNYEVDEVQIEGDFENLKRVFVHLINNSIDAISELSLQNIKVRNIEIYSIKTSSHISIFIDDTGCGIPDAAKIFNYFYSTKKRNLGLGLSVARKIVDKHNGEINLIKSVPGNTIFEIILPL